MSCRLIVYGGGGDGIFGDDSDNDVGSDCS